jgi:glycosyltransferase involved in cell wall biosynthesis
VYKRQILQKYRGKIATLVSEPDKGISDAFNKGIKAATGDWILFLNAGDYFPDTTTLETIGPHLDQSLSVNVVYGRIAYVNKHGEILKYRGDEHYKKRITWYMPFPHQSTFHRRSLFDTYGYFDCTFKRAMDYEFVLRVKNLNAVYTPLVISHMLLGGVSQTDYAALFKECERAHLMHFSNVRIFVWGYYKMMLYRVRLILLIRFIIRRRLVA